MTVSPRTTLLCRANGAGSPLASRARRDASVLIAFVALVAFARGTVACTSRSPRVADRSFDLTVPSSAEVSAPADPADDAVRRELAELDRVSDPLTTYASRVQTPPRAFRPIPMNRPGKWPGASFAEVRAFAFGFSAPPPVIGDSAPECERAALARDGTLCPQVVAPGVKLRPEQVAKLIAALERPDKALKNASIRCSFEPRHAFVFYDGSGVPIAELDIAFACGEWRQSPSVRGATDVLGALEAPLRALCDELGLGACFLGDAAREPPVREALDRRWHEQPRGAIDDSGVDPGKRMSGLSLEDKRRLCTWSTKHLLDAGMHAGKAFRCQGEAAVLATWSDCVTHVPACALPVGEVEACMRHVVRDVCPTSRESVAACDVETKKCRWGMKKGP